MGFLDDIKAGAKELKDSAKTELDSAKLSMRIAKLKGELEDLKKLETEAYASIGRRAAEESGLEKFGEDGAKVTGILDRIKDKEAEIAAEEAKKKAEEEKKN